MKCKSVTGIRYTYDEIIINPQIRADDSFHLILLPEFYILNGPICRVKSFLQYLLITSEDMTSSLIALFELYQGSCVILG